MNRNVALFRKATTKAVTANTLDLRAVVGALVEIYGFDNVAYAVDAFTEYTPSLNEAVRRVCGIDDLIPDVAFVARALADKDTRKEIERLFKQPAFVDAVWDADEKTETFRVTLGSWTPDDASRTTAETLARFWKEEFDKAIADPQGDLFDEEEEAASHSV